MAATRRLINERDFVATKNNPPNHLLLLFWAHLSPETLSQFRGRSQQRLSRRNTKPIRNRTQWDKLNATNCFVKRGSDTAMNSNTMYLNKDIWSYHRAIDLAAKRSRQRTEFEITLPACNLARPCLHVFHRDKDTGAPQKTISNENQSTSCDVIWRCLKVTGILAILSSPTPCRAII